MNLNTLSDKLLARLLAGRERYRLAVRAREGEATVVDAGIEAAGGVEAGRRIAEICMGGLGRARVRAGDGEGWNWHVDVHSDHPALACLASQYAGWSLSHGEGKGAFQALGSGPARALGSKEPLFEELGYRERAERTCLALEVDKEPPPEIARHVADQCGIPPDNLTLILTPTRSLAGATQIVARVLETALHKAHALRFPLRKIVSGLGSAPLSPPAADFLTAMSRTNDAILFAGQVWLFVAAADEECEELAARLPSSASSDYGRPFAEVFKAADYDFYQIDPMLFSPARVTVSSMQTGRSFHGGAIDVELLHRSFNCVFR